MELTTQQRDNLRRDGFVKIENVIPRPLIDNALRAINHSMGQGMNVNDMTKFRSQTFCPEICNTPAISELVNKTGAVDLLRSAIGEIDPISSGQVALRFPIADPAPRVFPPHIDGLYSPANGVPPDEIHSFTALLGVFLSDVSNIDSGNFCVWPGTHEMHAAYIREHGAEVLLKGMPKLDYPEPVKVQAKPGDVVIAHYLLAHSLCANCSPHIRYTCFFRSNRKGHSYEDDAALKDPWLRWDGMRTID